MSLSNYKIVADSSANLHELARVPFETAPLKIVTAVKEYVDTSDLDVAEMVEELSEYTKKSGTSCPSVGDWTESFGDAEHVFCITITSSLSGSFNAAKIAGEEYEKAHPGRRVFVIDSLSTGGEMILIAEKLRELIEAGKDFDEICVGIVHYMQSTGLLFVLESVKNLANNGRINPLIAKAVGLLGLRIIGKASDIGTLEQLAKCRGEKKAIPETMELMKAEGYCGGAVRIGHCLNLAAAEKLRDAILAEFPEADLSIHPCGALCSFYAEKGGLIIGFEKEAK